MGAQNKVIAGDYIGKMAGVSLGQLYIATSFGKPMYLNKQNIEAYELITDEQRKSAASGVIRSYFVGTSRIIGRTISKE